MIEPGPAFIPFRYFFGWSRYTVGDGVYERLTHEVPEGYLWRAATDHTMAGWVRPQGGQRDRD